MGSISSQYKQIGNAIPVNLAHAVGNKLIALLNNIQARIEVPEMNGIEEKENTIEQMGLFESEGKCKVNKHNKALHADGNFAALPCRW